MIHKIKTYFIHFLGGYTKEEYQKPSLKVYNEAYSKGRNTGLQEGYRTGFDAGNSDLAKKLKSICSEHYGCSKQEWIDLIYSEIQKYR